MYVAGTFTYYLSILSCFTYLYCLTTSRVCMAWAWSWSWSYPSSLQQVVMAYLLKKRSSALHIPKKRRMTMATCLSSSLDSFRDQDPPVTCRMRRRREKLGQDVHGLGHHHLDGHLLPILSRELWGWSGHLF